TSLVMILLLFNFNNTNSTIFALSVSIASINIFSSIVTIGLSFSKAIVRISDWNLPMMYNRSSLLSIALAGTIDAIKLIISGQYVLKAAINVSALSGTVINRFDSMYFITSISFVSIALFKSDTSTKSRFNVNEYNNLIISIFFVFIAS